jgi:hypothetical protein
VNLTGPWQTYGRGQKAHFHPRLVLDGKWMQFVGGDSRTGTNQIFLADVSDLRATEGVPWPSEKPAGKDCFAPQFRRSGNREETV